MGWTKVLGGTDARPGSLRPRVADLAGASRQKEQRLSAVKIEGQHGLTARVGPPLRPMVGPWPALVAVADTNVLATRACHAAKHGTAADLFTMLAATGRSNTYAAAHVVTELIDHLPEVAASTGASFVAAERVLWSQIMDNVPVVGVEPRDCLGPRLRSMLPTNQRLPRSMRGDPDDIETAALADLLAPVVILSTDSVFTRLGLSNIDAGTCVGLAFKLLQVAGVEARLADAAWLAEVAARCMALGLRGAVHLSRRYPLTFTAVLVGAVVVAGRAGHLNPDRWRSVGPRLMALARPVLALSAVRDDETRG